MYDVCISANVGDLSIIMSVNVHLRRLIITFIGIIILIIY